MGLSTTPCYLLRSAGFVKVAIWNVRFFRQMCVFKLKTWGHRILVFKSEMGFLGRVKIRVRASKHNDLGPSQRLQLSVVPDGAQKANFAQGNACPATGKWPDKRCMVTRFTFSGHRMKPEGPKGRMRRFLFGDGDMIDFLCGQAI